MPFDYLQQPEISELSSVMAFGNVDCTVPLDCILRQSVI